MGCAMGKYVHRPRERNIMYIHILRRYIYKNIWIEHHQLPIQEYKQLPQGPATFYQLHGILPQLRAPVYNYDYIYIYLYGINIPIYIITAAIFPPH